MRRFRLALVALAAIIPSLGFVPTVRAESYVIDPGASKGVEGFHGIRCTGEADAGGHHFRYVTYIGADEDAAPTAERGSPGGGSISASESKWQQNECNRILRVNMVRWAATPYNGEYCLLWNPGARNPGVDEPADLYCYRKPAVSLDPGSVKVTIQRV